MASVDWLKLKGANESKARFWHCDEQKRIEHEHSNKQIDKSRTPMNMAFGAFTEGYDAVCAKYDEMIAELDSKEGANKRKDRVTCVGWNIPAPAGMSDDEARKWFSEVYDTLYAKYGDCMVGGSAHFDEVHAYRDAETGEARESRPHLHVYAVPVVEGRLNAKQFMARRNMVEMNNAIERMTQEYFPSYKFMDGSKKKSKKSVEELKNESAMKEAEAEASRIVEDAQKASKGVLSDAKAKAEEIVEEAEKEAQKRSDALVGAKKEELSRRIVKYNADVRALRERKLALDAREASLDEREKAIAEREHEIDERSRPTYTAERVLDVVRQTSAYGTGTPEGNAVGRLKVFIHNHATLLDERLKSESASRRARVLQVGEHSLSGMSRDKSKGFGE